LPRNYWRCMTVIQLGSQSANVTARSQVCHITHVLNSSSAKLNFRLSVAGDVDVRTNTPQTVLPILVVESASCCPLHVHFKNTQYHLASFFLHGLGSRGYLGEEYYCVPRRRSLFLATPPANVSRSKRRSAPGILLMNKDRYNEKEYQGLSVALWNLYSQNVDSLAFRRQGV
jgi:hypothetical protein